MLDLNIHDLTFPMVSYGRQETRWDLRILLYKGGAGASTRTVFNQIAAGELGRPIVERIELVRRLHETMTATLVGGGAKTTASNTLRTLRRFFGWADGGGHSLSLETVEATYRHWCDFLLHCWRRLGEITFETLEHYAYPVSCILDEALERSQPLILTTRIPKRKRGSRAVGIAADKQNLADTFAFGHLCLDVIESTSVEAIWGPLPLPIRLRSGTVLEQWSRLQAPGNLATLKPGYRNKSHVERVLRKRAEWEADRTLRTRYSLVNLRLDAELLVFIAQTGMNLSQAHQLRKTQYSYKSTINGYEVRDYKHRRAGEVLFEIFAEYKIHFERYLEWCAKVFAGESTDRLFPFVMERGADESTSRDFRRPREICKSAGVPYVGPQKLRKTRVNWLLRQSRNPELTAEMDQHTKETLLRVYEQPSLQVAQVEIIQFWKKSDPRLGGNPMPCPAPGVCDGKPKPIPDLPPEAPKPDCTHPSGCLFCDHHRDIDSEDYLWSATSMRHLNTVILAGFRPAKKGKDDAARHVELAIEVLTAKLKWFQKSNNKRKAWVEEAVARIAESAFHPHWRYLIESAEGV